MNPINNNDDAVSEMQQRFAGMREAYLQDSFPDYNTRIERLDRLVEALNAYSDRFIAAIDEDYQGRSELLSQLGDVFAPKAAIRHVKQNLKRWMKAEKRRLEFPYWALGYKGKIEFQPKGVVGVIAPWNGPVALAMLPAVNALAAGNRVMLKPSGQTANTERTIAEMIAEYFDPEVFTVITGRGAISRAFPAMPFDHIVFTGGPVVARDVMRAAAENLTPLTLELGGKCPVYISRTADVALSASKIVGGKLLNSGQVCVSPDYVFVPSESIEEFIAAAKAKANSMYPSLENNRDFTAMFGENNLRKLQERVDQAKTEGIRIESLVGNYYGVIDGNKMAPVIVVDPANDLEVMCHESFGPVLIIKPYEKLDDVIDYVQRRDSPLVFYYFGKDEAEISAVTQRIQAGNMSINDVVLNIFVNNVPFGGVGESGMGRYYGRDGFEALSNRKGVVTEGFVNINRFLHPPFSDGYRERLMKLFKKL